MTSVDPSKLNLVDYHDGTNGALENRILISGGERSSMGELTDRRSSAPALRPVHMVSFGATLNGPHRRQRLSTVPTADSQNLFFMGVLPFTTFCHRTDSSRVDRWVQHRQFGVNPTEGGDFIRDQVGSCDQSYGKEHEQ